MNIDSLVATIDTTFKSQKSKMRMTGIRLSRASANVCGFTNRPFHLSKIEKARPTTTHN